MLYVNKFRPTIEDVAEAQKRVNNLAQRKKRVKKELSTPSREMQMVPKYLELAEYKGRDRFNSAEISEITNLVKMYGSKTLATDLIKQLLSIGVEKENPMSAQEMKDFFLATLSLNEEGQNRVITFIKTLKENPPKYNPQKQSNNAKDFDINDYIAYRNYMAYANKFGKEPLNTSNLINTRNRGLVYGVAKCKRPEVLAEIVFKTGAIPEISEVPNELVRAYELSKGNLDLVQDLAIGFYPIEIKQIISKLEARKGSKDLSEYYSLVNKKDYYYPDSPYQEYLSDGRKNVLKALGLSKQIVLYDLPPYGSVVAVDGSFEQGKRR